MYHCPQNTFQFPWQWFFTCEYGVMSLTECKWAEFNHLDLWDRVQSVFQAEFWLDWKGELGQGEQTQQRRRTMTSSAVLTSGTYFTAWPGHHVAPLRSPSCPPSGYACRPGSCPGSVGAPLELCSPASDSRGRDFFSLKSRTQIIRSKCSNTIITILRKITIKLKGYTCPLT